MPSAKYISTKHQAMQEGDTQSLDHRFGVKYMSICIYLYLNTIFEYLYFEVLKQHVFVFVFKYFMQKLKILSANTLLLKFLNK